MSEPSKATKRPSVRRGSVFIFSRLFLQEDGSFISRPVGIHRAETFEQALAMATIEQTGGKERRPMLFRVEQVIQPKAYK